MCACIKGIESEVKWRGPHGKKVWGVDGLFDPSKSLGRLFSPPPLWSPFYFFSSSLAPSLYATGPIIFLQACPMSSKNILGLPTVKSRDSLQLKNESNTLCAINVSWTFLSWINKFLQCYFKRNFNLNGKIHGKCTIYFFFVIECGRQSLEKFALRNEPKLLDSSVSNKLLRILNLPKNRPENYTWILWKVPERSHERKKPRSPMAIGIKKKSLESLAKTTQLTFRNPWTKFCKHLRRQNRAFRSSGNVETGLSSCSRRGWKVSAFRDVVEIHSNHGAKKGELVARSDKDGELEGT